MTINLPNLSGASDISGVMIPNPQSTIRNRKSKIPHSSPSCLPPRRPGAPRGNKNAVGHGAPRGNKNGLGHGAPRGNRNAFKFGVYTREFARPIVRPPGLSLIEALELEIHRLRLYVRDELASVNPTSLDFRSSLSLLRAITIAVGRIRRLHHHIHRFQTAHAFESDLGRSIARKLHLFPTDEQESRLSAPLFSRSPLPVRGGAGGGGNASQDNCLLVPLFSHVPDLSKKSDVSDVSVVGHACCVTDQERMVHDNLESGCLTKQPFDGLLDLNRQMPAPQSQIPPWVPAILPSLSRIWEKEGSGMGEVKGKSAEKKSSVRTPDRVFAKSPRSPLGFEIWIAKLLRTPRKPFENLRELRFFAVEGFFSLTLTIPWDVLLKSLQFGTLCAKILPFEPIPHASKSGQPPLFCL